MSFLRGYVRRIKAWQQHEVPGVETPWDGNPISHLSRGEAQGWKPHAHQPPFQLCVASHVQIYIYIYIYIHPAPCQVQDSDPGYIIWERHEGQYTYLSGLQTLNHDYIFDHMKTITANT